MAEHGRIQNDEIKKKKKKKNLALSRLALAPDCACT